MTIPVKCPSCSYKGQVPEKFQGRKVKCPSCSQFFTVGSNGKPAPKADGKRPAAPAAAPDLEFDSKEIDISRKPGTKFKPRAKQSGGSKVPLLLGLVALVSALAGAGLCFVPNLTMIVPLVVGVVGVLFALLGLIWNMLQQKFGALPLMSLLLSGGAIALALLVQAGTINLHFGETSPANLEQAKPDDKNKNTGKKEEQPLEAGVAELLQERDPREAGKAIRTGNARVTVTEVEIAPVGGKELDDKKAQKPHLLVRLKIENAGAKPLDYRGGGDQDLTKKEFAPVVVDDQRHVLKFVSFGAKAMVDGQLKTQTIAPGETKDDVLIFEKPTGKFEFLRLGMEGANFGGAARLKVHIPGDMVVTQTVATKPPTQPTTPTPMPMPKTPEPTTKPPMPPVAMLDAAKKKELEAGLKDPNRNARREALEEIEKLGPKAAEMAPEVVKVLDDKDDLCRVGAAEALGKMGPVAAAASLLALHKSLDDEFQEVQKQAAIALGNIGAEAKLAVPGLQKLARETKDKEVLKAAQDAIKKIDPKAPIK